MKESNIRYIVVVFYQGVGYTLQTDDKPHIFFHHPALVYKKLGHAKNKADKMTAAYLHDKVCVFKVKLDENLSCDQYNNWCEDEDRLEYESIYRR
jgi:hypothetical protein